MEDNQLKTDFFEGYNNFTSVSQPSDSECGKARLKLTNRDQVEFHVRAIDDLITQNHKARCVWEFVSRLDLSKYLKNIKSIEGGPGRSSIDPKILVSLWLYATIEGIASASQLYNFCMEHYAFIWLRGGVKVGRKTLSNFRGEQGALLNDLLVQSVATMMHSGLISIEEIGQDGMRVRAHAGSASFRTLKTLKEHYKAAKKYLEDLQKEIKDDAGSAQIRQEREKLRRAKEKKEKLEFAINELRTLQNELNESKKKQRKPVLSNEKKRELRASKTDPEARKMKMGDGGFRPAYNVQFATTVKGQVIAAVSLTNKGSDYHQLEPMYDKIKEYYGDKINSWLADNGFNNHESIEKLEKAGCKTYIPPKKSGKTDPYAPKKGESKELADRRHRMGTEEGKKKYKLRPQTAEFPNAEARNRGLTQFLVRGMDKALNVSLIFALTHNFLRMSCLGGLI